MEARRADEADEDALIDRGVVGLVLVGAVVDAGAVVEQEIVDASCTSVDRAVTRVARLLALSTNAVDGSLLDCHTIRRLALAALRLAGGISVEDKVLLARGAGVDVADTGDAVLLASLALLLGVVVDLDVRKAGLEAFGVEGVEAHVVLTGGAGVNRAHAGLAGRVALCASFAGCTSGRNANICRAGRQAVVLEEEGGADRRAAGAVRGLVVARGAAFSAFCAHVDAWLIDVAGRAVGDALVLVGVEEEVVSYAALGAVVRCALAFQASVVARLADVVRVGVEPVRAGFQAGVLLQVGHA